MKASSAVQTSNHALGLERKRPLRTYGRRTQPDAAPSPDVPVENKAKRRRIEEPVPQPESAAGSGCLPLPQLPSPLPPPLGPRNRASILSFFKPLESGSSAPTSPACTASEPVATPASTPPSSPPTVRPAPQKRRRRLTTRPDVVLSAPGETRLRPDAEGRGGGRESNEHPQRCQEGPEPDRYKEEGEEEGERDTSKTPADGSQGASRDSRPTMPGEERAATRPPPQRGGEGPSDKDRVGAKGLPDRRAASRAKTIQTTLNLSVGDDPAFRICHDCNVLYNPLNETDRKDHARRHAILKRMRFAKTP